MNLFVDHIRHAEPRGSGFAALEQELREALDSGQEFAVEAGKRAEFDVPAGAHPVVYVMEGSVRFEGDDTAASAGDVVWFKPAGEGAQVGVEADAPARGVVVFRSAPRRAS